MYHIVVRMKNGVCVPGDIVENEMKLPAFGEIVRSCWLEIPEHFENVELEGRAYEMHTSCATFLGLRLPNHVHGIIIIRSPLVRTRHAVSVREEGGMKSGKAGRFGDAAPGSLSTIVGSFKSAVSKEAHLADTRALVGTVVSMTTFTP
jgi:putative transposase